MPKTKLTLDIEKSLLMDCKMGRFNCPEVKIGNEGIVDVLRYEKGSSTKPEKWICFEIKVSLADFNSKQKKTFVGNYNYYAMTAELYSKVADKIPDGIGVYTFPYPECVKKAKYRETTVDTSLLFYSMMKSMKRINQEYLKKKYYKIDHLDDKVKERDNKIYELETKIKYINKLENTFLYGDFLEMLAFDNIQQKDEYIYYVNNDNIIYKCRILDYFISLSKKEIYVEAIAGYLKDSPRKTKTELLEKLPSVNITINLKDFTEKNGYFKNRHEAIIYNFKKDKEEY